MRIMNKNNTNAVPLNTTTLNTRLLNTTKLNTIGFPVLSKRSGSSADISQAIMDSLVCWYDIGKQQCTNESMAANPVLADLSGNGHDIECFNFGWAGMSGIGGYVTDFTSVWSVYSNAQYTKNQTTINVTHIVPNNDDFIIGWLSEYITDSVTSGTEFSLPPVRFKVTGIADLQLTAQVRGDEQAYTQDISEGVEYYFPGGNFTCDRNTNVGFVIEYKSGTQPTGQEIDLNLVVEILPEYPNALVSDGVDDYCNTDGLPILTDYTVIAKRKWLQTENDNNDCFAAKGNILASFLVERYGNNGSQEAYSFGQYNGVSFVQEDIIYQTKESYNGYPLKVGTATDVDNLVILGRTSAPLGCIQAALYSFLLFDRTLTTAEIEWVKKNMIESGGGLATNWADSSLWKNYLDGSRGIGVVKSTKLIINTNIIGASALFETNGERTIDSFTIKVTGLQNDIIMYYKYYNGSTDQLLVTMIEDGVYTLPQVSGRYIGFMFNKKIENENIVIQQLLSE